MKGSGIRLVGISTVTAATLMKAWTQIQAVTPPASRAPKRSGARSAARIPPGEKAEPEHHGGGPDQPELLLDDRVDEVGVRLGQRSVLLLD